MKERKLVFKGDSYEYVGNHSGSNTHFQSNYYYYFQTILLNQPIPVLSERFGRLVYGKLSRLHFSMKVLVHMFAYY